MNYIREEAITYDDVLIVPAYSTIPSRTEVDISSHLTSCIKLTMPIMSSNMHTITEEDMARAMRDNGAMGIIHRFCSKEREAEIYSDVISWRGVCDTVVSIGVKDEDIDRFELLWEKGARIFCIDVAHGYSKQVKDMIARLRLAVDAHDPKIKDDLVIIAGNIATPDAAMALQDWGADVVKVGIGPSPVCRTRLNTGVGMPQLSALMNIRAKLGNSKLGVIADGGIKCVGDIAKALLFADAVCLGSMLAGTTETPGVVHTDENGRFCKIYGGSASALNKPDSYVEGIVKFVPFRGHVKYILKSIREGLQSAFSYVGASTLAEFREYAVLQRISNAAQRESHF